MESHIDHTRGICVTCHGLTSGNYWPTSRGVLASVIIVLCVCMFVCACVRQCGTFIKYPEGVDVTQNINYVFRVGAGDLVCVCVCLYGLCMQVPGYTVQ